MGLERRDVTGPLFAGHFRGLGQLTQRGFKDSNMGMGFKGKGATGPLF